MYGVLRSILKGRAASKNQAKNPRQEYLLVVIYLTLDYS